MTEERYINDMLACLRAERDRRPDMQAEDIVKYIFQGMLGVGICWDPGRQWKSI